MAAPSIFTETELAFLRELVRQCVAFMVVGLSAAALQGALGRDSGHRPLVQRPRRPEAEERTGSGWWSLRTTNRRHAADAGGAKRCTVRYRPHDGRAERLRRGALDVGGDTDRPHDSASAVTGADHRQQESSESREGSPDPPGARSGGSSAPRRQTIARALTCAQLISSNLLEAELRSVLTREAVGIDPTPRLSAVSWIHPDRPLTDACQRLTALVHLKSADL